MNNKKIQAQMEVNVSFIADGAKLVKSIENQLSDLKLNSSFTKGIGVDLEKTFKTLYTDMNKMGEGLSKKGLSVNQYNKFFDAVNNRINQTVQAFSTLEKRLDEVFNSEENQKAIKDLAEYKKQLDEINKLLSKQKGVETRKKTAINKLKEETGLDYDNAATRKMLSNIQTRKGNKQDLTKTQQDWVNSQKLTTESLKRALELYTQIESKVKSIAKINAEANSKTKAGGTEASIEYLEKEINKLHPYTKSDKESNANLLGSISNYQDIINLAKTFGETYSNQVMPVAIDKATQFAEANATIKEILGQFGIVLSSAQIFRWMKDLVEYSFNFYKSLDTALNQIYIVSDLTSEKVQGLTSDFIHMAKTTGMAIDDITRAAVLFYQQGLSTDEVLEMTEVTAQFAKVAGIDATDAADKLTAAVNGYCLAAEDASSVADKFNQVAAVSAADINELSTAFSKAAAQANQAGVSMDNYLAYIATMEEATREAPENIGTSLKTIFSRMQQVKESGTTEDGDTDVNKVETALESVGIALRDAQGELRDLEEVFDELGPKWNTLDRNTQAYLGTIIAGTRQQSRFITLMQNWDRVLELAAESENSAGMQALMHAKAMESMESKIQQAKVAWQEFVKNIGNSEVFKGITEVLTGLINLFNSGSKPIYILSTAVLLLANNFTKLGGAINKKIVDGLNNFKKSLKGIKEGFQSLKDTRTLWRGNGESGLLGFGEEVKGLKSSRESLQRNLKHIQANKENAQKIGDEQEYLYWLEQEKKTKEDIAQKDKEIANLTKSKKDEQKKAIAQIGTGIKSIGTSISMAGIALMGFNEGLGETVIGFGTIASGIGQMMIPGQRIIGIITTAIGLFETINAISNAGKRRMEAYEGALNNLSSKLDAVASSTAAAESYEKTLNTYNKLINKIARTTEEQEELNSAARSLSESVDGVDTLTDSYGNLTVNIQAANEALKELKGKRDDDIDTLYTQERETISKALKAGILGENATQTLNEFIANMYGKNASAYRALLKGIPKEIEPTIKAISESTANEFNSNLQNAIINEVKSSGSKYKNIAPSLTRIEDKVNAAFSTSPESLNDIYQQIGLLQDNINDMSYDQVQEHLNEFYDDWEYKNLFTLDQWNMIVEAINGTVFKNNSLLGFYKEMDNWESITVKDNKYQKDIKEKEEEYKKWKKIAEDYNESERDAIANTVGLSTVGTFELVSKIPVIGTKIAGLVSGIVAAGSTLGLVGGDLSDDTDENLKEKAELAKQAYDEASKAREAYLKKIVEENDEIDTTEQAESWIKGLVNISDAFRGATTNVTNFIGQFSEFYNLKDINAKSMEEYGNILNKILSDSELTTFTNASDQAGVLIDRLAEAIENTDDVKLKEKLQKQMDEVFASLKVPGTFTWKGLASTLDEASSSLRTMNGIVEEINENGGLTLDTFTELCDILDSIDVSQLLTLGEFEGKGIDYLNQYATAIENLNLGIDANTGILTMNGETIKSVQKIQELATKQKLAETRMRLEAEAASLDSALAYITAQKVQTEAEIKYLKNNASATTKTSEIKTEADKRVKDSFKTTVDSQIANYQADSLNAANWARNIVTSAKAAATAISSVYETMRTGNLNEDWDALIDKAFEQSTKSMVWQPGSILKSKYGDEINPEENAAAIKDLENYLAELDTGYNAILLEKKSIQSAILGLKNLEQADLSKLGTNVDTDKIDQYIGKLKEIYNILNRIQILEHRLSTLDSYAEVASGEDYGNLLKERVSYNKELLNQYEFLTKEQKQFTNGYKDFINSVEGLEGVFDFDKYGQIIINWEKYNSLQDKSIDGEVTLKEKADDVYETYTQMFEDLQGYFDNTIKYYKQVIDLQQEIVDSYTKMQNSAADAVKEIYQKILDTKLDAIDQEKEAIEDLRKAREDARKDQENAKEVSGLQTNLQRAMMDTSGASDISLIKAQQDLDDKLSQMAEDKYSEMLDNIIAQLDEEQEALQDNFDMLFENLDWLFSWLDKDIMGNESELYNLLQQTDKWQQSSFIERRQQLDEWKTDFAIYNKSVLENEKGIYGIWDNIKDTKERIRILDENLQSSISKGSADIAQTLGKWADGVQKTVNKIQTSNNGGGANNRPNSNPSPTVDYTYTKKSIGANKVTINEDTKFGTFGTVDDNGVRYQPDNVNGDSLHKTGFTAKDYGISKNSSGYDVSDQNLWYSYKSKKLYVWNGTKGIYELAGALLDAQGYGSWLQNADLLDKIKKNGWKSYRAGGFANFTGPAWLDGTKTKPEAVLNALQTEHFINFTNALDKLASGKYNNTSTNSSVNIDTISFNVESMNSVEDGEKAFNMFVDKFKEIGNRTGIKVDSFKNTL